ncbi:hypothetical protein HDV00_006886 [Rhizophlyctis rosea]|nr:hypothetical protein HDV00_006886 [Rhizophlyctis rosea]
MYLLIGWFGGAAFPMPGSNLISAIQASDSVSSAGKAVNNIVSITYPILVLLTSIPVSMIIVKLNLVSSRICSKGWASFWATWLPFAIAIPFQTGNWVTIFANWTSLVFQSLCNFVAPFLVYLYLHKRNLVMQESVIEELEFLELDSNLKKYREDDDDFDYCYHLPHADLTRLGIRRYNPFGPSQSSLPTGPQMTFNTQQGQQNPSGGNSEMALPVAYSTTRSISGLSTAGMSTTSGGPNRRQLMKQMLGPMGAKAGAAGRLGVHGSQGSRLQSSMNLGGGGGASLLQQSRRASNASRMPPFGPNSQQPSMLGVGGLAGFQRRISVAHSGVSGNGMTIPVPGGAGQVPPISSGASQRSGMTGMFGMQFGANNPNKIHPMGDGDYDDVEAKGSMMLDRQTSQDLMKPLPEVEDVTGSLGYFRAMPPWFFRLGGNPRWVAWISFVLLFGGSLVVLAFTIIDAVENGIGI